MFLFSLRYFNFEPSFKLRWCRARDLFGSQIPVTTRGFELQISCKSLDLVCKRFAVQTLLWSLEFVIQINLEHDTIAVSVFVFTIIFCYHIKRLLIISKFLSKWYQNSDDKLTRECVQSVFQPFDSRLIYHRSLLLRIGFL